MWYIYSIVQSSMNIEILLFELYFNSLVARVKWAMPFIYNFLLRVNSLLLYLVCNLQICECPVLFARLEVLNLSGNRLTDACGSYLSTILEKCKGKTLFLQPFTLNIVSVSSQSSIALCYSFVDLCGFKPCCWR